MAEAKGTINMGFSKKPLTLIVKGPKSAAPGEVILLTVNIENLTKKKINCIQLSLQNTQKREVDKSAFYPPGFPVATNWNGEISYILPVALSVEIHTLYVEPIVKKSDNLKVPLTIKIANKADAWKTNFTQIFEVPLAEALRREKTDVPKVLISSTEYLRKKGLDDNVEGIFRISGSADKINQMKEEFDKGHTVDLYQIPNPHTVSGLFKLYLRSLPEPLLTYEQYDDFLEAGDIGETTERVEKFKALIGKLPRENIKVVSFIFLFLAEIEAQSAKNKMSAENLSIVFAPIMLKRREESKGPETIFEMPKANKTVKLLILSANDVFT